MASVYGATVARCRKCSVPIGDTHPYAWCVACGEQLPEDVVAKIPNLRERLEHSAIKTASPHPATDRKTYPAVRTLAGAYRALAYLILCFRVLASIITGVQANDLLTALPLFFYTAFVFVVILAAGEVLAIMPDLADRVAETNSLLREIRELLAKKT